MKVIFNSNLLDWNDVGLSQENRGFRYGDGFFESISIIHGAPRFLEHHLTRLTKAAKVLQLDVKSILEIEKIDSEIATLKIASDIGQLAKMRLLLWRNSKGLYTPEGDNSNYLITIENRYLSKLNLIENAGFSKNVFNSPSPISSFKTLSAMKYVLAGIEKNQRKLDEIIISNQHGLISETMSSNIFWKVDGNYFTPPISTGCIEGIMRNQIISMLKQKGFAVVEKLINEEELLKSRFIFTTNAMEIRHIQRIGENTFETDRVVQKIIESISLVD